MWTSGIGRAFSPFGRVDVFPGALPRSGMVPGLWPSLFAPVWYSAGPLALAIRPGLVWSRAFGPRYLPRSGMVPGLWPSLVGEYIF